MTERLTSGLLYRYAAELYDRGEWDAARKLYEAADELLVSEALANEAEHERPTLVPTRADTVGP